MSIELTKSFNQLLVLATTKEGAEEIKSTVDGMSEEKAKALLKNLLDYYVSMDPKFTPPSEWSVMGKDDPHGSYYSSNERNNLAMGNFTDDQLANAAFLLGDGYSQPFSGIAVLTGAKERIRWLSRRVNFLEAEYCKLRPRMHTVRNGETLYGIAKTMTGDGDRWPELHEINRHIPNPNKIKTGDSLMFPDSWLNKI